MSRIFNKNLAKSKVSAFSLVELLVAIVIVGILSAIAIPSYRDYMIESKITSAVALLREIEKTAIAATIGEVGLPTKISFAGSESTSDSMSALDMPPVTEWLYGTYQGKGMLVCVLIGNLNLPDVSESVGLICSFIVQQENIFKRYCGHWDDSAAANIPIKYLPADCRCTNMRITPNCP